MLHALELDESGNVLSPDTVVASITDPNGYFGPIGSDGDLRHLVLCRARARRRRAHHGRRAGPGPECVQRHGAAARRRPAGRGGLLDAHVAGADRQRAAPFDRRGQGHVVDQLPVPGGDERDARPAAGNEAAITSPQASTFASGAGFDAVADGPSLASYAVVYPFMHLCN